MWMKHEKPHKSPTPPPPHIDVCSFACYTCICMCTHVAESRHTDPCLETKAAVPGWDGEGNSGWFQCSALHTLVPQPHQLRPRLGEHLQSRPPKFHWFVSFTDKVFGFRPLFDMFRVKKQWLLSHFNHDWYNTWFCELCWSWPFLNKKVKSGEFSCLFIGTKVCTNGLRFRRSATLIQRQHV